MDSYPLDSLTLWVNVEHVYNKKMPCKNKSVDNERFCPYRAYCLQHSFTP